MPTSRTCLGRVARTFGVAAAAALWLTMPAPSAAAPARLDIAEVRWGFDGRVVPERFNVLTVRVANLTGEPFDGALRLAKSRGVDVRSGAPYAEPCYLAPYGTRWVQFYPFIAGEHDEWRLEWGRRPSDQFELPRPAVAAPARVLLLDESGPGIVRTAFQTFPEGLFPPTAAATMGLDTVILDHVPRWEAPRREAFLDWLRAGGRVHLLLDEQDRTLVFPEDLAALNAAAEGAPARVGAGTVVRHAATRHALTPEALAARYPEPSLERSQQIWFYDPSGSILRALSQAVRVRYRWWLINIMAIGYVVAIGPGVHLLARRWRDYRLTWLALLATVLAAAALFHLAGRRGRGETSAVYSLSVARELGSGRFLVTQWIDVFAARGAQYRLTHEAPCNLYATTSENEPVNGVLESGRAGAFTVDIPVCSHRPFMHQAVLASPSAGLKRCEWTGTDALSGLSAGLDPAFARSVVDALAVFRGRVYPLERDGDRLVLSRTPLPGKRRAQVEAEGTPLAEYFSRENLQEVGQLQAVFAGGDGAPRPESIFRPFLPCLMLWSLCGTPGMPHYVSSPQPADQMQIFVLAESPPSFRPSGITWGRHAGYTLYRFEPPAQG